MSNWLNTVNDPLDEETGTRRIILTTAATINYAAAYDWAPPMAWDDDNIDDPDTGGNVVTAGHKPYSAATLQRSVNRAFARAGIHCTSHALRHRYGTMAYQATGDLLAVGRMMGHASPVTTAIYADPSSDISIKIAAAVVR